MPVSFNWAKMRWGPILQINFFTIMSGLLDLSTTQTLTLSVTMSISLEYIQGPECLDRDCLWQFSALRGTITYLPISHHIIPNQGMFTELGQCLAPLRTLASSVNGCSTYQKGPDVWPNRDSPSMLTWILRLSGADDRSQDGARVLGQYSSEVSIWDWLWQVARPDLSWWEGPESQVDIFPPD